MVNMHDQSVKAENGSTNGTEANGESFDQTAEAVVQLAPKNYCGGIPATGLFIAKYHQYPCTLQCDPPSDDIQFHVATITKALASRFKYNPAKDTISKEYHRRTKKSYIDVRVANVTHGIMIQFCTCTLENEVQNPNKLPVDHASEYFLVTKNIQIFYLPEYDELAEELSALFYTMTVFTPTTCSLQMVCRNQHGYYLSGIKIKKPVITDMALHYGQKFVGVHDKIIQSLNQKEGKGIVLLHGVPGSGKTHYIRYLIQEIKDKTLIYIPPDMAKEISSPAFLPFLMEYPESILIIEDAENIIKDRNETLVPSQAVANLLNLSDGLLGDAMHQQIIATFNCDLTTIDPALLRKGRLIANYEFNKLDLESSKKLSDKLGFGTDSVTEPMTLAEIYNQGEQTAESEKLAD